MTAYTAQRYHDNNGTLHGISPGSDFLDLRYLSYLPFSGDNETMMRSPRSGSVKRSHVRMGTDQFSEFLAATHHCGYGSQEAQCAESVEARSCRRGFGEAGSARHGTV